MDLLTMLGLPFVACLLLTGMLSCLGLHVLKREVIFIDITVAQVAALGAIAAHMFLHVHGDSWQALACAVGATSVAALFFAVTRRRVDQLPVEATIGITYAVAAAGALLLIGKSASGHTHVQEMLTGSLLWVEWRDLMWAAIVFAVSGASFVLCRRPFQEISDSYGNAARKGLNVVAWDFLFYALCGLVITFAVRLAGVVVVFCFLIIPATISVLLAAEWRACLLVACAAGAAASICGLLFSQWLDFSAGVSVALFLGVFLAVGVVYKKVAPGAAGPPRSGENGRRCRVNVRGAAQRGTG